MTMTRAQQQNGVSEGIAFGLLLCGRRRLRFEKPAVSRALQRAWTDWPDRERFPAVTAALSKHRDGSRVLTFAGEGSQVFNYYWVAADGELVICPKSKHLEGDVDMDDLEDEAEDIAASIAGDVSAESWRALAEAFFQRLPD